MGRSVTRCASYGFVRRVVAISLALDVLVAPFLTVPVSIAQPMPRVPPARAAAGLPSAPLAGSVPNPPGKADPPRDDQTGDSDANRWGEITVAQPKIWQYERVNTLLDGLLRDVEGVSLADLTALDPNATNGAAVKFVQSMLEIGAQYNQGAAVTNAIALQNYRATQGIADAQLQANSAYLQQLYQERQSVMGQLLTAQQQQAALQAQEGTATGATLTALQTQATAEANEVSTLQQELGTINSQITAASAPPPGLTPPTVTPTGGPTPPETANEFSDFLSKLPSSLQTNIMNQLSSPSLPATKRMDNFITLLYERLAREISALQDDLLRDPNSLAFLVQFDVGLYPSKHAKNDVGMVEFTLNNCPGCRIYSVYPGQSSYNLANYSAASKRNNLFFSFISLIGFGLNADYRRQEDTLRGDLVQSVYMSGFQEGAPGTDRKKKPAEQRFGWYYGSSPFEQLVTPGIRSTFAIVTVPRSSLPMDPAPCTSQPGKSSGGGVAQQNAAGLAWDSTAPDAPEYMKFDIQAHPAWVARNNPTHQRPSVLPSRSFTVDLPGAAENVEDVPKVVLAERGRLHVLGLEYNPVYSPVDKKDDSKNPSSNPPPPGTATASASGTGAGTASASVSPTGTATASSSGTNTTTATASASSPPSSKDASPASTTDSFTSCPKYQCAAVLIKLAEPIDPNLVVAVQGEPLRRVRDWRGRATSILPPVQSESDFPPPATGAPATPAGTTPAAPSPTTSRYEAVPSRSLLEADNLGPDTWLQVDSHRLLLNISKNLGDIGAFPSIQIVAPAKRALLIPIDLDESFTEIATNGFHLPARNGKQLGGYVDKHFLGQTACSEYPGVTEIEAARPQPKDPDKKIQELKDAEDSLKPSGPYAYGMFLPLFLPQPPDRPIQAFLGETGRQILISLAEGSSAPPIPAETKIWAASRDQVILEDKDLDLAWALTCLPRDPYLVCDIPQREIRDSYRILSDICNPAERPQPTGACPSIADLKDFPSISTLQVWVEQYANAPDEIAFRSYDPARFARVPIEASSDPPNPDENFRPWHFDRANPTAVTVAGCNYPNLPTSDHPPYSIHILGSHIPDDPSAPHNPANPELNHPGDEANSCWAFDIPTIALTHPEVVIDYKRILPSPDGKEHPVLTPDSLATVDFAPHFGDQIIVTPHHAEQKTPPLVDSWIVSIPANQVDNEDSFDSPDFVAKFLPVWKPGEPKEKPDCPHPRDPENVPSDWHQDRPDTWPLMSKTSGISLYLHICREDLDTLASLQNPLAGNKKIQVTRDQHAIAKLPDIRSLILPTKLSVAYISSTQFAIQGPNAGIIDQVAIQGPTALDAPPIVSTGVDYALVTVRNTTKSTALKSPAKTTFGKLSATSGPAGSTVLVVGAGLSATDVVTLTDSANPNASPIKVDHSCTSTTNIGFVVPANTAAGKYSVALVGPDTKPIGKPQDFTVTSGAPPPAPTCKKDAAPSSSGAEASGLSPGTYTVLPLVTLDKDRALPLEVTDKDGKPLALVVVPEKPKTDNSNNNNANGPTTTITITKKTTAAGQTPPSTPTPSKAPTDNTKPSQP